MKITIKNVLVFSWSEAMKYSSIHIQDDRIVAVGEKKDFLADKVIDGKKSIAMPGLVNAHSHCAMSLFRNYADDMNLHDWLQKKIWPIENQVTEEDAYYGSLLSIAEMIRSGVTTFADMYFFEEATAKAVLESGVRANLSRGLVSFDDFQSKLNENCNLHKEYHGAGKGRIRISFGPHAPDTVDNDLFSKIVKIAKEKQIAIQVHLSESKEENEQSMVHFKKTPTERLYELGVFDVPCIAAHGVHLSANDINILKKKGVSIIHNPSSNLKLASGIAPVQKCLDAGVNVALGTDGSASNNNQNMWEELHLASLIGKVQAQDPKALDAKTALKMATINGAKALGFDDIGSLEIGKKADIILIGRDKIHHYPRFDVHSELVYSTQASDVHTVLVDGKILMENYKLLTIDEEKVKQEVEKRAKRLADSV